ncbi:hypothetical protein J3A83DRAFT_4284878 [Scleroderma citrinum]
MLSGSVQPPVEAAEARSNYSERMTPGNAPSSDQREEEFPPQRHAGAVGIGPEFVKKISFTEKIAGIKEEIKGRILRKPELVKHGHDRRTGTLGKTAREQAGPEDPSK